jgi:hypothetical protein
LAAGLLAVVFGGDLGTVFYAVGVAALGTLTLLFVVATLNKRQQRVQALAVYVVCIAVTSLIIVNQAQLRRHILWLIWSNRYKTQALANSTRANTELKHIGWEGDGWGSGATGDWMGYVVFDPSDSLAAATKTSTPTTYQGIPCTVIAVRRLEKHWYSVVLEMNKFWDKKHPAC